MTYGREGMTHGPTHGETSGAQGQRSPAGDRQGGWSRPGWPAPCDALRLLAAIVEGACAPVIAGDIAKISVWIPFGILDDLLDCIDSLNPGPAAPGPADASGAWSGVLLPMQREAERILPEIFDGIGDVEPHPAGGYDLVVTLTLAVHDRLALWGASLDLVAHLIEMPDAPPVLPLTALELGVPQEMAALVLGLYAAEGRPALDVSGTPGQASAA